MFYFNFKNYFQMMVDNLRGPKFISEKLFCEAYETILHVVKFRFFKICNFILKWQTSLYIII